MRHVKNKAILKVRSHLLQQMSKLIGHGYGSGWSYEKPGLKKQYKELR